MAGKQLLAAFQPQFGGDKALVGSKHQRLPLQVFMFVLGVPLALIVITAVSPRKVGGKK